MYKKLLLACKLGFLSLYAYAHKLVKIITNTTLANSSNLPSPQEPTEKVLENILRPTTQARALPQTQLSGAPPNVFLTLEIFSPTNTPQSTMPTRALPQIHLSNAHFNDLLISETFSTANAPWSTIAISALVSALPLIKLPKFASVFLAPETFFINAGLISNLNNRLKTRELLQIIFSNIRQKQYTLHKRKVPNPHEIVLDLNSSNTGSILANTSFGSIGFANNGDNQKNSILKTIYKSSNQIFENRTNIEYKPVKKKRLTFEKKQVRVVKNEAAKLQVVEKKKLEKETKRRML